MRPVKDYNPETDQLKPAGFKEEYEPWQIAEIAKCAKDPFYFFENYVYVRDNAGRKHKFRPYDYQKRQIKTYLENRKVITMLPRQAGKTTSAAVFILWWSIFKENQVIVVCSHQRIGAVMILDRLWDAYLDLPSWIKPGVVTNNVNTKKFDNGTKIVALPATKKAGRGETPSLLYVDELAFVEPNIANEFWTSVSPSLACVTGDTLIATEDGFFEISRLIKSDEEDLNIKVMDGRGFTRAYKGFIQKPGPIYELVLENGLRIKATPKHPLRTTGNRNYESEMVPVRDIRKGDFVEVWKSTNVYGTRTEYSEKALKRSSLSKEVLQLDRKTFFNWLLDISEEQEDHLVITGTGRFINRLVILLLNAGLEYSKEGNRIVIERSEYLRRKSYQTKPKTMLVEVKKKTKKQNVITYDFTTESHVFLQNLIAGSNTGGHCIITSTPSDDESIFARIWMNAKPSPYSDKWYDGIEANHGEEETVHETIFETDLVKEKYGTLMSSAGYNNDDEKEEEDDGFVRFFGYWRNVPIGLDENGNIIGYRDDKFKYKELKAGITIDDWLRDYECHFTKASGSILSAEQSTAMRSTVMEPVFVDRWFTRWYANLAPNTAYAVAMDPSGDDAGDDCAIQVWELPTMKQVAEWNSAIADQEEQTKMLWRILKRIEQTLLKHPEQVEEPRIYYGIERNGLGLGIIRSIEFAGEDKFPGMMIDATDISSGKGEKIVPSRVLSNYRGLVTTATNKRRYVLAFKDLIDRGIFKVRSRFLSSQLKTFVKKGRSWAAQSGAKDDLVMSCVLMMQLIDEVRAIDYEIEENLPLNTFLVDLEPTG